MFTKDKIWILWLKCYSFSQCGFAQVSSVQLLSPVWLSVTSWTAACQPSLAITNRACSHSWPLSRWYHPTISSSVTPFSSRLQSFPASRSFAMSPFFTSGGQSIGVSISVLQWIFRTGLVGSPCSPRNSQKSSPKPQFKNINSSVLSFLYTPALTSIHDHWKNHSID